MKSRTTAVFSTVYPLALIISICLTPPCWCTTIPIDTFEDLLLIGQDPGYPLSGDYVLTGDLVTGVAGFTPIGSLGAPFTGTLDGAGFTISGLSLDHISSTTEYTGLFVVVGTGARIESITLEDCLSTQHRTFAGFLVGELRGTLSNCHVTGATAEGGYTFGGLVGKAVGATLTACSTVIHVNTDGRTGGLAGLVQSSTLEDCTASGSITGKQMVGGLVGHAVNSSFTRCRSDAQVTGNWLAGGLLGSCGQGTLLECSSTGPISGISQVGGLCGANSGTIRQSFSKSRVSGRSLLGGLVGSNVGLVDWCYATGDVTGTNTVGGLVGVNRGAMVDSYAVGLVFGTNDIGGLVGTQEGGQTERCYTAGLVTGVFDAGGLVGSCSGTVSDSFYDQQACGVADNGCGQALDHADMLTATPFTAAGWNFSATWTIQTGASYPHFPWCPENGTDYAVSWSIDGASPVVELVSAWSPIELTVAESASYHLRRWETELGNTHRHNPLLLVSAAARSVTAITLAQALPLLINTQEQLRAIGSDPDYPLDWDYELAADIVLSNATPTLPLGGGAPFRGKFNGAGHSITFAGTTSNGLLGTLVEARVNDLALVDVSVLGACSVGGLAGVASNSLVEDVSVTGIVQGDARVGGIIGDNQRSIIVGCSFAGQVGREDISWQAGGLTGVNSGTVEQSCAVVTMHGAYELGGLAGHQLGCSQDCYAWAAVLGTGTKGGLVGYDAGTLKHCYASPKMEVTGSEYGGLVGYAEGEQVTQACLWNGDAMELPDVDWSAARPTALMTDLQTWLDAGWNIATDDSATWRIVDGTTYPLLTRFNPQDTSHAFQVDGSAALGLTRTTPDLYEFSFGTPATFQYWRYGENETCFSNWSLGGDDLSWNPLVFGISGPGSLEPREEPCSNCRIVIETYAMCDASLILDGSRIYWLHRSGWRRSDQERGLPTMLNGWEWYPEWPADCTATVRCGQGLALCQSYPGIGYFPALPETGVSATVQCIGSSYCPGYVAKYPSPGDPSLEIRFSSADEYPLYKVRIEITWPCEPPPVFQPDPCLHTQCFQQPNWYQEQVIDGAPTRASLRGGQQQDLYQRIHHLTALSTTLRRVSYALNIGAQYQIRMRMRGYRVTADSGHPVSAFRCGEFSLYDYQVNPDPWTSLTPTWNTLSQQWQVLEQEFVATADKVSVVIGLAETAGIVDWNWIDLVLLPATATPTAPPPLSPTPQSADFDGSGDIDAADLLILMQQWYLQSTPTGQ